MSEEIQLFEKLMEPNRVMPLRDIMIAIPPNSIHLPICLSIMHKGWAALGLCNNSSQLQDNNSWLSYLFSDFLLWKFLRWKPRSFRWSSTRKNRGYCTRFSAFQTKNFCFQVSFEAVRCELFWAQPGVFRNDEIRSWDLCQLLWS